MTEKIEKPCKKSQSENGHIRIRKWDEFKKLVIEKNPKSIVYILEQNGFSPKKEISILRVIMLHNKKYYIFLDFPKEDTLRETKILLSKDKSGFRFLEDEKVKEYLKGQFINQNLSIFSFWTA